MFLFIEQKELLNDTYYFEYNNDELLTILVCLLKNHEVYIELIICIYCNAENMKMGIYIIGIYWFVIGKFIYQQG